MIRSWSEYLTCSLFCPVDGLDADPLLQGGALVIDRAQGTVELLHRDKFAGDHAPIDILFEAAKEICPS